MIKPSIKFLTTLMVVLVCTINCQIILPQPEHCSILTFLNICIKCEQGYELNEEDNICNKTKGYDPNRQVVDIQIASDTPSNTFIPSTLQYSSQSIQSGASAEQNFISSGISIDLDQDINCKVKGADKSCLQCYTAFYYDKKIKQCVPVSPLCRTWTIQGSCTSCYQAYQLKDTECVIEAAKEIDLNCAEFNGNICIKCAYRFVFNSEKVCISVDPDCKTWDSGSGGCLSCYEGYNLRGTICQSQVNSVWSAFNFGQRNQEHKTFVDNCAEFNRNNECVKCAFRYFFQNGKCHKVNDLCKSWQISNGQCISCYEGYQLFNGQCLQKISFCSIRSDQGCVQCQKGYYLNQNLGCDAVNPLCKAYDPMTGFCTNCYYGYKLAAGECITQQ